MTLRSSPFLRLVLGADAVSCAAMGIVLLTAAGPLSGLFGLPEALLRGAGLVLMPFAAGLAALALRTHLPQMAVVAVIGLNLLWVADSVLLLVSGWCQPTMAGVAFVLAQAVAVLVVTELEWVGMRRSEAHTPTPA